jgi:hypothetical protein
MESPYGYPIPASFLVPRIDVGRNDQHQSSTQAREAFHRISPGFAKYNPDGPIGEILILY